MRYWFVACVCALIPAALSADGHVSIGVACRNSEAIGIQITMTRPDIIVVPIAALHRYCELEGGKPS